VRAAAAPNQNVTRGSRGPETVARSTDRASVVAEAVRTAAAPDQNVRLGFARQQQGDLDAAEPGGRTRRRLARRQQALSDTALRGPGSKRRIGVAFSFRPSGLASQ
jgi:hypothetical protein